MLHFIYYCIIFRLNVNKALTCLEGHLDDISSADIYIEPPHDSGSISEEDSNDEDQPTSLNHLSGKQLNASAGLVLHQPVNASCVENETSDLETTEPPTKKSKSHCKKTVMQWAGDDLHSEPPVAVDSPIYHEKQWSPAKVFEFFFL